MRSDSGLDGVELHRDAGRLRLEAPGGAATVRARVFADGVIHAGKREAADGEAGETALVRIARALAEESRRTGARVLSLDREADAAWNRMLFEAGFVLHRSKRLVERDLTTLEEVECPFTWRTLAEMGDAEFLGWLSRASLGDPFEDEGTRDYDREFQELLDHAGERLDRDLWRVALLEDEPVGVVLPQAMGGDPPEGTLSYLAVLPSARSRGLGRRLHLVGLALLKGAGIQRYVGSTDMRNEPMARIFERNGCRTVVTQLFFRVA